jgi:hypothetical protein
MSMDAHELANALVEPTMVSNLTSSAGISHREWMRHFSFDLSDPSAPTDAPRRAAQIALKFVLEELYTVPAPFKRRTTRFRVSHAQRAGMGVTPEVNHGFSFLSLLEGHKQWFLAPPTLPCPGRADCTAASAELEPTPHGATHRCEQRVGETMVVPTGWWHATCNWAGPTIGIGGEDDCGMIACAPPAALSETVERRSTVCLDHAVAADCFRGTGEQRKAASGPKLLEQPLELVRSVSPSIWKLTGLAPPTGAQGSDADGQVCLP